MDQHKIFVSYSHGGANRDWVRRLVGRLRLEGDVEVILDEDQPRGSDVDEFMDSGIETADFILMVLTPDYAKKAKERTGGVGAEAGKIRRLWKQSQVNIVPVLRGEKSRSMPDWLVDTFWVDMTEDAYFEEGVRGILRTVRPLHLSEPSGQDGLAEHLTKAHLWPRLLSGAVRAVTAGGTSAMSLYLQEARWPEGLPGGDTLGKNPSTLADLEATSAMLETIDSYLAPIARRAGCALKYLAEETKSLSWFEERVNRETFEKILPGDRFFSANDNEVRVILDGIDGTGSFVRGIPLFCSALAILIGKQPRVAAIYDPIHQIVYSALLATEEGHVEAEAWSMTTGNRIDLAARSTRQCRQSLRAEAVGVHFTRSHPEELVPLLRSDSRAEASVFETLSRSAGTIYALNSGLLAMVEVARGALGGFFNVMTNLWDVAAGEVLIRACGGKVTDLKGQPIDYSVFHNTSVLAAPEPLHSALLGVLAAAGNRRRPRVATSTADRILARP